MSLRQGDKRMREIRFRGKRVDNGEWVYGDLLQPNLIVADWCNETGTQVFDLEAYAVIPETIGQFTGLKDKNGNKIFEGDVVKQSFQQNTPEDFYAHEESHVVEGYHQGVVKITPNGVSIMRPYFVITYDDWDEDISPQILKTPKSVRGYRSEILGNIHDNPELLDVKEG